MSMRKIYTLSTLTFYFPYLSVPLSASLSVYSALPPKSSISPPIWIFPFLPLSFFPGQYHPPSSTGCILHIPNQAKLSRIILPCNSQYSAHAYFVAYNNASTSQFKPSHPKPSCQETCRVELGITIKLVLFSNFIISHVEE